MSVVKTSSFDSGTLDSCIGHADDERVVGVDGYHPSTDPKRDVKDVVESLNIPVPASNFELGKFND